MFQGNTDDVGISLRSDFLKKNGIYSPYSIHLIAHEGGHQYFLLVDKSSPESSDLLMFAFSIDEDGNLVSGTRIVGAEIAKIAKDDYTEKQNETVKDKRDRLHFHENVKKVLGGSVLNWMMSFFTGN